MNPTTDYTFVCHCYNNVQIVICTSICYVSDLVTLTFDNSGVRDSGAAAVDAQSSIAGITIEGGNKPHGIVSISPTSREIRVLEDAGEIGIHIDRKFGAIGKFSGY